MLLGSGLSVFAQPKASFDKTMHEFGTILWKNPVTATFKITNKAYKPLVISNVTTSCGCTVTDWTKSPILPGKTGEVSSTFDAKALGRFRKSIGVYCNASDKPVYLSFRGEVTADPKNYTFTHPYQIGAIRLNKEEIEFDDANRGDKTDHRTADSQYFGPGLYTCVDASAPYLSRGGHSDKLGRNRPERLR